VSSIDAATIYLDAAAKRNVAIEEGELLQIVRRYPGLINRVPDSWITHDVAECVITYDPTLFQHCGDMRGNHAIAKAAIQNEAKNWEYVHHDLLTKWFSSEEFIWWGIDKGLINQHHPKVKHKEHYDTVQRMLSSEKGLMCLLARQSCLTRRGHYTVGQWVLRTDSRFQKAYDRIVACKQPFDVMVDIHRKRVLIGFIFFLSQEGSELQLVGDWAQQISSHLTVPLQFYGEIEREYTKKQKPRYPKFARK